MEIFIELTTHDSLIKLMLFYNPFQLFAVLFFLMIFTLGVGSATALTGCVITVICDQFPQWNKSLVTLGISIASFIIGLAYVTPVS